MNLYGLFIDEIAYEFEKIGVEKYRASQVAEWMYKRGIHDFSQMTNLPKEVRSALLGSFSAAIPEETAIRTSADGKTTKFLLKFKDEAAVETVLMRQPYGNSVCVSTQVGCAMGCAFCATGVLKT